MPKKVATEKEIIADILRRLAPEFIFNTSEAERRKKAFELQPWRFASEGGMPVPFAPQLSYRQVKVISINTESILEIDYTLQSAVDHAEIKKGEVIQGRSSSLL